MGQKVNPIGIRLGITRDWTSKWYAGSKTFASNIHTDHLVRKFLNKKLADASVSRIHIERAARRANITIHTARPGIVIGKKGEDIEKLRTAVAKILGMTMNDVRLNIAEIRKPELDAKLVAEGISQQLEKRVMFRRAMKRAVTNTMRSGALGIKVRISGRLNGSEIARTETNREGRVPLHTFRADIDYGVAEAQTTYGVIGIKVWIFKGEVFDQPEVEAAEAEAEAAAAAQPKPPRHRLRPQVEWVTQHDAAEADQVPQTVQGQDFRQRAARQFRCVRRVRPQGDRPVPHDGPGDRGGAAGDFPPRQARRPNLDPGFPGRADHPEAARSAHGFGQGQRRVLGGEGASRQGAVRDRRHERGDRARGVPFGLRQAVRVDGVRQAPGPDMKVRT